MRVGPLSAGSDLGLACYARGSYGPTITDANLVLGRLGDRLGNGMVLNKDLAREAISKLADKLGTGLEETAYGIIKIANSIMAKALRIVTIERGYDPREFTMFVFGGAGPLHGVELAEELNISSVLIPPNAGVFSAFGLLSSDYRVDRVRSIVKSVNEISEDEIEYVYDELVDDAIRE